MSNKDFVTFYDQERGESLTLVKPTPEDGYYNALLQLNPSSSLRYVRLDYQQILDMIEELYDCVQRIENADRKAGIALKKRVLKRLVELGEESPWLIRSFREKTITEWHSACLLEPDGFTLKLLATSLRIDEWMKAPSNKLTEWVKSKPLDYWLEQLGVLDDDTY